MYIQNDFIIIEVLRTYGYKHLYTTRKTIHFVVFFIKKKITILLLGIGTAFGSREYKNVSYTSAVDQRFSEKDYQKYAGCFKLLYMFDEELRVRLNKSQPIIFCL